MAELGSNEIFLITMKPEILSMGHFHVLILQKAVNEHIFLRF